MKDIENAARDRACLYLYASELAAVRGDEDEADEAERRAWELLDPFSLEMPARTWAGAERYVWGEPVRWRYPDGGESFDLARAAGREEVRDMLTRALNAWLGEEDAALQTFQVVKDRHGPGSVLTPLRRRVRAAEDAVNRICDDIECIDLPARRGRDT